jgi:hypothetical protein
MSFGQGNRHSAKSDPYANAPKETLPATAREFNATFERPDSSLLAKPFLNAGVRIVYVLSFAGRDRR